MQDVHRGEQLNVTVEDGLGRCLVTHRNPCVLVQDDLEKMWREDGWCFKPFLWFPDVRLLMVGSWWGTGQLCWEMVTGHLLGKLGVLGTVSICGDI